VYAKRGLAALVASLIVLNCSGLHFPIINPRGDLDGRLRRDLGVPLPPSAVIDQSYRVAYRDPERVYSLHMSPPAVAPFITSLRTAAASRGYHAQGKLTRTSPGYGTPAWWLPQNFPDGEAVEFVNDGGGYIIVYSPTLGQLYVAWHSN
jgi:hypothetical protein